MPDSLRIAYLIGQFPAINHFYLLLEIRRLRELGVAVKVASIDKPDRPLDQLHPLEREEAPSIYCVNAEPPAAALVAVLTCAFTRPLRFCRGLAAARRFAASHRKSLWYALFYCAQAVLVGQWMTRHGVSHVHASFSSTVALLVTKLFPVTMSFGVYGFGELYDPYGFRLAEKIAASRFVRSVSRHGVGQLMLAAPPELWDRLQYIPLGIDPSAFPPRRPFSSPTFNLLTVGRLSPEKGIRILLAALARLGDHLPTVRLHIVGDGPDRSALEREVARLGLAPTVTFEGWVEQTRLNQLYETTSAFVLASLYEGTPIVLMEAMSMEVPCIAPAINGIPELMKHGHSGLLVHPADPEDLERSIRVIIEAPELAARLGKNARHRIVESYDIDRNTGILADVFQRLT